MNESSWWGQRLYYRFWHDWLKLPASISSLITDSIHHHLLAWDLTGSLVLSTVWVLLMHFIDMGHRG